jgi:hypothetical protein
MADYSEVQHGFASLKSEEGLKILVQSMDQSLAGAGSEALQLFDSWWHDTQFGTFITSISEHDQSEDAHGRLSMWRAFGGATARVAFVLKIPLNATVGEILRVFISPVAYSRTGELTAEFARVSDSIRNNLDFLNGIERPSLIGSIFYLLVNHVVCTKHEGFHEEREWRIVYNPKRVPSEVMVSSVEVIGGVPQIVYKLPLAGGPPTLLDEISIPNILDRVIVGPSAYPWAMFEAFVSALSAAGVADAASKVFVSGIPLRS